MTAKVDLGPAARRLAELLGGITDEQLTAPTPCPEYRLGDLLEHVSGLAWAFTDAAAKTPGSGGQPPAGDASRLSPDWRTGIPEQLAALARAWTEPAAWEGLTRAGGVELPAEVMGMVALNELVVHGWDVARASGQPYTADQASLEVSLQIVTPEEDGGSNGPFGPPVPVPADASLQDRVIGLSGRDPAWSAN